MSLVDGLRDALRAARSPWADASIEPLPDSGLAHAHLRLAGTGVLARVPKQSQMDLPALANLDYQAACFTRAAAGGHAPRLLGVLPPSAGLPRGALLVEEIVGRPARLPQDLPAIVDALAVMHSLPLPEAAQRAPLLDPPTMEGTLMLDTVAPSQGASASHDGLAPRLDEPLAEDHG